MINQYLKQKNHHHGKNTGDITEPSLTCIIFYHINYQSMMVMQIQDAAMIFKFKTNNNFR